MSRPPYQAPNIPSPPKRTPGGVEPFQGGFDGAGPVEIPPDSSSGNSNYTLVYTTDDQQNYAPVDDDGEVVGVGYQS